MDASLLWFLHKPVPHSFCYFSLFFRISYVDKMKYYPIHSSLPPINCPLVLLSILPLNLMYFFHNLLRLISVCHICKDVGWSTRWWKNYHWAHSQKKNGSHCNHNPPASYLMHTVPQEGIASRMQLHHLCWNFGQLECVKVLCNVQVITAPMNSWIWWPCHV